jgi:succinate-semialdehyde dehydrogenase/glutarate-semialdehyde dehydrogenase
MPLAEPALPISPAFDTIISINPATEQELGRVPVMQRPDVDLAIENARHSFRSWSQVPLAGRRRCLQRLIDLVVDEKEAIAELIAREQGKPVAEALAAEVVPVLAVLKFLIKQGPRQLRHEVIANEMLLFVHKKSQYRFVPYGVVAIVSPWNFPFSVPLPQIAAALLAGNTVLFKPAPASVLIGKKIDDLLRGAGLPTDVVTTLFLDDRDAPYLTEHDGIDKIIFTGSTEVGHKVMASAAKHVRPVVLELGGKDAAVVAADADVERAAKGIVWGSLFASGQVCASVERVYVEKPAADRFIKACLQEMQKLRVGDPMEEGVDIGPLTTSEQLAKVIEHVQDAVQKGAKVMHGGERVGERGFFFQPTLLVDVNHSMKVMSEETFGPILPIMVVNSLDEAIRFANDSEYGLSAFGWTQSRKTAERLMAELEAGTVLINDSTMTWGEPTAPWVGFKRSGVGLTRSRFGLLEMMQIKYVSYDSGGNKTNMWWFPYAGGKTLFMNAVDLLYKPMGKDKAKGLVAMLTSKRFLTTARWPSLLSKLHKLY